jgi:pyruvate/2-oxoglutarate dehydrogenase complex dihydrolipoamide dehydrogenase (E3) component
MRDFDAIVIGTGQAGPSLANRLTEAGKRVAVIERGRFGGTCVNTGCTPTKALVASAYAAQTARRAAEYGVMIEGGAVMDMKKVKARKDAIAGQSSAGVERWLKDNPRCTVFEGHARFTGPRRVSVNGQELSAPHVFINVGGGRWCPTSLASTR